MEKLSLYSKLIRKKVLLIGGAGFVGQNLIETLVNSGAGVSVLSRSKGVIPGNVETIKGDVRNKRLIKKVIKGKFAVIDLASLRPLESVEDPILDLEVTCKGALNILESCKEINSECKIVFFGSSLEYGNVKKIPVSEENNKFLPNSFYGAHKQTVSHYSRIYYRLFGINSTFLRFSNIYGPEKTFSQKMSIVNLFIKLALKNKEIRVYGDGSQVRDYLYIDDALNALVKAIFSVRSGGQIFNIGSGQPTSVINMARSVIKIAGKGKIRNIPWPENYKYSPEYYQTDYGKAKNILGWKPIYNLEEGIKLTVEKLTEHAF